MSKHKLDMFRQVLPNLDKHNLDYYDSMTDDEKAGFAGVVAMRFMSSSGQNADWYLIATNERSNPHFHEMWKHPELQWKLLASCGLGKTTNHSWIANSKKGNSSEMLHSFILRYWAQANSMEVDLILNQFTEEEFGYFVDGTDVEKDEAKKLKASFKLRL